MRREIEITEVMVWQGVAEMGRHLEGEAPDFLVRRILEAALAASYQSPIAQGLSGTG